MKEVPLFEGKTKKYIEAQEFFFKYASEAKGYENVIREIPPILRRTSMKKRYKKFNGKKI